MDNERPIEKLLRDYAKRRRADAGETLEMHPATRRILQGEVARQFPKSQRTVSPLVEFFARWRPGFVYALCVLAIVAVSVPLLLPTFRKAQPDTRLAAAVPDEEAADKKRPADSPSVADEALSVGGRQGLNEAAPVTRAFSDDARAKEDSSALRFEEEKQKSQPARPLMKDTLVRSVPVAPAPAPKTASRDQPPTATSLANQSRSEQAVRELRVDAARGVALEASRPVAEEPAAVAGEKLGASRAAQSPKPTDAPAGIALAARSSGAAPTPTAATPAAAPELRDSPESAAVRTRYGLAQSAVAVVVQKYSQMATKGNLRRSTDADRVASPVLATFRLEQTGDKLRVIDSDGSTYTGAISLPASVASYGTAVEMKNEPLRPDSAPVSQPTSAPAGIAGQSSQNYYFRVTGTNRTLQQPVVFAGNIQVLTNVPPVGQTAVTQLPVTQNQNQFTPAQNQLPSLLNSTISGNVRLGTNQEMQINAVPVNP